MRMPRQLGASEITAMAVNSANHWANHSGPQTSPGESTYNLPAASGRLRNELREKLLTQLPSLEGERPKPHVLQLSHQEDDKYAKRSPHLNGLICERLRPVIVTAAPA